MICREPGFKEKIFWEKNKCSHLLHFSDNFLDPIQQWDYNIFYSLISSQTNSLNQNSLVTTLRHYREKFRSLSDLFVQMECNRQTWNNNLKNVCKTVER